MGQSILPTPAVPTLSNFIPSIMHVKHSITVILVLLVVVATVQSQKNAKKVKNKDTVRASLERRFKTNGNQKAIKELANNFNHDKILFALVVFQWIVPA